MILLRSFDADQRPSWLLADGGEDPVPVLFSEGIRQLKREGGRLSAGATGGPPFAPDRLKDLPFLPPFGGTKILCVGRNYRPHAEELGNPIPTAPLWFTKPPSSLLEHQGTVILPSGVGRIDYEGELALVIGRQCRHLTENDALSVVCGVTAALDITARELQKSDGQWTRAKGFDTFCPLGPWIVPFRPEWLSARLVTALNGKTVQEDHLSSLIFSVPRLLVHLTACMTLEPGDVILTGTPAGVGPLKDGDQLRLTLAGPEMLELAVQVRGATEERKPGGGD